MASAGYLQPTHHILNLSLPCRRRLLLLASIQHNFPPPHHSSQPIMRSTTPISQPDYHPESNPHFLDNRLDHLRQPQPEPQPLTPPHDAPRRLRLNRYTPSQAATSITWLGSIICALLWTLIILVGLAILIIYLVFRPRSPRFDVSAATLNGAYLDTGTLLNADLTLLANFSNHNRKVGIAFASLSVDLYFKGTLIATQAIEPFVERAGESVLRSVHMVSSEVALSQRQAAEWRRQLGGGGVEMEVEGRFRTRSDLGSFLHFDYWLYGHCRILVGGPPTGVLVASKCRTKR